MSTAQTVINRALRLIGALDPDESPSTNETANGLEALNALIDSWRNDRLIVWSITTVTKTLTPGDGQYSIGASADINTTRPVKIVGAYVTDNGSDYPVDVIYEAAYRAIGDKTTQSTYPGQLYYDPAVANGTIYLYPVPSAAKVLTLSVWAPISTLATAGTTVTLPPGYERALASNLAIDLAPEFQKQASQEVAKMARDSLAAIRRANIRPIYAQMEMATGRRYDIRADA